MGALGLRARIERSRQMIRAAYATRCKILEHAATNVAALGWVLLFENISYEISLLFAAITSADAPRGKVH